MHWKFWLPLLMIPVIYLAIALSLTLIRPEVGSSRSLNFDRLTSGDSSVQPRPLLSFEARDGQALSFTHHPSDSNLKVILLHGSGYHGSYLAPLADYLTRNDIADVYVPNVRGHLGSGDRRGDIEYIGQLEDDIDEVAALILQDNPDARICIGGHSSGGALAMRYASSEYGSLIYCFFGLAPFLGPEAPTMPATDPGWAHISLPRIIGLSMLNTVGIHALDGLETIRFNLPEAYRDGTETLGYSWRLMTNFALNRNFENDIAGLPVESIVFVGSDDEALDADAFVPLFSKLGKEVQVIDGLDHFGIVLDEGVMLRLGDWLSQH